MAHHWYHVVSVWCVLLSVLRCSLIRLLLSTSDCFAARCRARCGARLLLSDRQRRHCTGRSLPVQAWPTPVFPAHEKVPVGWLFVCLCFLFVRVTQVVVASSHRPALLRAARQKTRGGGKVKAAAAGSSSRQVGCSPDRITGHSFPADGGVCCTFVSLSVCACVIAARCFHRCYPIRLCVFCLFVSMCFSV